LVDAHPFELMTSAIQVQPLRRGRFDPRLTRSAADPIGLAAHG
jgi:hypothetical protein